MACSDIKQVKIDNRGSTIKLTSWLTGRCTAAYLFLSVCSFPFLVVALHCNPHVSHGILGYVFLVIPYPLELVTHKFDYLFIICATLIHFPTYWHIHQFTNSLASREIESSKSAICNELWHHFTSIRVAIIAIDLHTHRRWSPIDFDTPDTRFRTQYFFLVKRKKTRETRSRRDTTSHSR